PVVNKYMNTAERHRLKDNEIVEGLHRAGDVWEKNSRSIVQAVAVVAVVAVLAAGYWWWQHRQLEQASALLADARNTAMAPLKTPPPVAVPGQPTLVVPPPSPDAFDTEAARRDAALKKYQAAAAAFPSTSAGLEARLHAAGLLGESGRVADAEKQLEEIVRLDADSLYGRMAKLGIATIQVDAGRLEPAIATLTALSQRADLEIPVDGVLMQLGHAYDKAGKPAEAVRAFTRIGDEFPESPYAGDAKTEAERLKARAGA
ncbi:MAG: tetratricopeptide repeat protein, partial [Vicinamibacteraceae bacterium]